MPRRDSNRADQLKLGGQSCELLDPEKHSSEASERTVFDWAALYRTLGLGRDERVFMERKRLGETARDIGQFCDWSQLFTERIRKRVDRAIVSMKADRTRFERPVRGGDSLRLVRKERLESGRQAWTLATLTPRFLQILAAERKNIFAESRFCPNSRPLGGISRGTRRVEHKIFTRLDLKAAVDEPGTFSGILSSYGNVDEYGDTVAPGAYTKTLKENGNRLPLLWQHDSSSPIGEVILSDSPTGLRALGKLVLDDAVPDALRAYALLKAKVVRGMSIGYQAIKSSSGKNGTRILSEIRLHESSLVTLAADPGAMVTSVKSAEQDRAMRELEHELDKWKLRLAIVLRT